MKKAVLTIIISILTIIVGVVVTVGEVASIEYVTETNSYKKSIQYETAGNKDHILLNNYVDYYSTYRTLQYNLVEDKELEEDTMVFEFSDCFYLYENAWMDSYEDSKDSESNICYYFEQKDNTDYDEFIEFMKSLKHKKFVRYTLSDDDLVVTIRYASNLKDKFEIIN